MELRALHKTGPRLRPVRQIGVLFFLFLCEMYLQILTSLIRIPIALQWRCHSLSFLVTWTGRQTKVYFIKEGINNNQGRGCTIIFSAVLCGAGRKGVRRKRGLHSTPPPKVDAIIIMLAGGENCQSRSYPTVRESVLRKEEESYPLAFYLCFDSFFYWFQDVQIQPKVKECANSI